MGKKEAPKEVKAPEAEKEEPEEEDSPVIKQLKAIDDKYCAIEAEFEAEVEKLKKKYEAEKQKPLLEERLKALSDTTGVPAENVPLGTPACKGFWLQALQNDDTFSYILQEYDEPVMEYLDDIRSSDLDPEFSMKGHKLEFVFKENPFFSNESLCVEYRTNFDKDTYKPYNDPDCVEIKSSDINWKEGKNVTVEIVEKKVKGGGAKKAKQKAKAKEEKPRESFFRTIFVNLKEGEPLPPDVQELCGGEDDDEDDASTKMFLEQMNGLGMNIREGLIKYAVRFYTGEAGDADDDDDDEDEESEDEEDDDDDDDDDDDEPPPTKSQAKKKPQKKDAAGAAGGQKQEECKQQ